jgi:hypothetical protein
MIRYECDRCGVPLKANDLKRFILKMEIYAAAGPIELDRDPQSDTKAELEAVLVELKKADPDEVEDKTYRSFRFDLCDDCRRELIEKPLGRAVKALPDGPSDVK